MSMQPYGAFPAPQQPQQFGAQQFTQQPGTPQYQPQHVVTPQPGFPAQQFTQQFAQQPQPTGPAPAAGSLDAFNHQPVTGRPNGVSWKDVPLGTTVQGVVERDVTDQDVNQDTDPQTKQLKFYRDGRPQFNMAVTLRVQPSQQHPEGLATLYVRGRMKDALAQAMAAAGADGAPKAGDLLSVTLTERRSGQGSIPANIYAIQYQRPGVEGQAQQPQAPAPAPQPVPMPTAPQPEAQPVPMPQAPAPQPEAQPVPMPQAPAPGQEQAPAAPGGLTMTPEQAALLAKLTGQTPA